MAGSGVAEFEAGWTASPCGGVKLSCAAIVWAAEVLTASAPFPDAPGPCRLQAGVKTARMRAESRRGIPLEIKHAIMPLSYTTPLPFHDLLPEAAGEQRG